VAEVQIWRVNDVTRLPESLGGHLNTWAKPEDGVEEDYLSRRRFSITNLSPRRSYVRAAE
jgi:hypothetical protein